MSFPNGSISFRTYKVIGNAPKSPSQEVLDKLVEHTVRDSDLAEEVEYGWSGPQHIMDSALTFENVVFGQAMHFGLRIDTNKVPADVKKAHKQVEESTRAAENPSGFISKIQKREAAEAVRNLCATYIRERRYRKSRLITILWDFDSGVLYTSAHGASAEKLHEIFDRTFKLQLEAMSSGVLARDYAQHVGLVQDYEDLRPTRFVIHRGDEGLHPEYPWVAKLSDPKAFLGNEFLLWLWYRSKNGIDVKGGQATVFFDRSLNLECAYGQTGKQALRGDAPNHLPEALIALTEGKVPRSATMTLDFNRQQYLFNLQAESLAFGSLRLPEIEDAESPRVLFEERINLLGEVTQGVNELFKTFLRVRLSPPQWELERGEIQRWICKKG